MFISISSIIENKERESLIIWKLVIIDCLNY